MPLGETIKKLRKERNWTQDELAEKLGVHPAHLTRWEKNKMRPRPAMMEKLAGIFDLSVDALFANNVEGLHPISDPELFAQFQAIERFPDEEKQALKTVLQAMIERHQVKSIVAK